MEFLCYVTPLRFVACCVSFSQERSSDSSTVEFCGVLPFVQSSDSSRVEFCGTQSDRAKIVNKMDRVDITLARPARKRVHDFHRWKSCTRDQARLVA